VIVPAWVSRDLGWLPAADYLSRVAGRRRQAEWSIPSDSFERACAELRVSPTLDAYASRHNAKCTAFRSRYPEPGSSGDALAAGWHRVTYAFPPFSQITLALQHFCTAGRSGDVLLLLAPPREVGTMHGVRRVRELALDPSTRLVDPSGEPAPGVPPRLTFSLLIHE
jgi:hypothetical protein